ncbi:MAG: response regulator [Bdellovibrionota bacterium]
MSGSKILIVEDHPDTQLFLATVLKMKGYVPVVHSTATSALADAAHHPDLKAALVDLSLEMPIETFIKSIRALPSLEGLQVVIVSGRDWTDRQAKEVGAQTFLRKPCDLPSLMNAVKSVVKD